MTSDPTLVHYGGADARPTSLHGDGARALGVTTLDRGAVTCKLCRELLRRQDEDVVVMTEAARWNSDWAVGTPVYAWPGVRDDRTRPLITATRSPAWTIAGDQHIVSVEGYPGGIALTHIQVRPAPPQAVDEPGDSSAGQMADAWLCSVCGGHFPSETPVVDPDGTTYCEAHQ